jgi:hypothetical protein
MENPLDEGNRVVIHDDFPYDRVVFWGCQNRLMLPVLCVQAVRPHNQTLSRYGALSLQLALQKRCVA